MACSNPALSPAASDDLDYPSKSNGFEELVQSLKDILGPSSGLTSEDIDVGDLMNAMEQYVSDDSEWSPYAMGDASRGYTRNLVDEGNGKSNLVRTHRADPMTVGGPFPTELVLTKDSLVVAAYPRLDARQGQSDPRPRQRALRHEDPPRHLDRNAIRLPRRRQQQAHGHQVEGRTQRECRRLHGRRAGRPPRVE